MITIKDKIEAEILRLRKERVSDEYAEGYNDALLDAVYWIQKLTKEGDVEVANNNHP